MNPTIRHQMQPTSTSCGPTCVAMLVGKPVAEILDDLPRRYSAAKLKKQHRGYLVNTHSTNISEVWRLLSAQGFHMGPKQTRIVFSDELRGLLRVHRTIPNRPFISSRWHWCVIADGIVFDPAASSGTKLEQWIGDLGNPPDFKVFYYGVTPNV